MMWTRSQKRLCARLEAQYASCRPRDIIGVHWGETTTWPVHGLRHPPEGGTSGWYIWRGDWRGADTDFYEPYHAAHLRQRLPAAVPYLGLAPGHRFPIAPGVEDVWFDASLLPPSQ